MAYEYKVEVMYDSRIPQTALPGFAPTGIAKHWSAGGTGRQGALGTRTFFMNTAAERNASYHLLVYWEAAARIFGAIWIVDPRVAAHSLAPQPPSAGGSYDPNAEVKRILGSKVGDPNAGCIAVSFCGMPADLEAALRDPDFVAGYRRLYKDLLAIPSLVSRPLFNHGWAQPTTRRDAGDTLIPLLYGEAPTQGVDDMQYWKPVQQDWNTRAGTRFWDGEGAAKVFTDVERVRSIAASSDGLYRLVAYGPSELLVVVRSEMDPIPGTRVPSSGYAVPTGGTVEKIVEVPDPAAAEKAVAEEKNRIRGILGL